MLYFSEGNGFMKIMQNVAVYFMKTTYEYEYGK